MNIPVTGGAVAFEPFGGYVANRMHRIGTVLSTSDPESFHLAVAEGMMSRATGAVLPWRGADAVNGAPRVVPDLARGAERMLAQADPEVWERRRQAARASLPVADRNPGAWAAPNRSAR